jgi:hypothetical protein
MPYVVAALLALFGLAVVLDLGGIATWGSQDRSRRQGAAGDIEQVRPLWVTKAVGVVAIGMALMIVTTG